MPKAKKKKVKRTVTCGKCKGTGHNARTCPGDVKTEKSEATVTELPPPVAKVVTEASVAESKQTRRRAAPTADMGSKAGASPYRCQKCNQVAILVIVRTKDHQASFKKGKEVFTGEMRCEHCMNKPNPAERILVWGAKPDQKVTSEDANA